MATITSLTWNFRPSSPWEDGRGCICGTCRHTVAQQASERYDTLMKGYAKSWEITESLKSEDPMQWVGRMQLARSEAEHNVMTELICI